jgi:hypothetical protein
MFIDKRHLTEDGGNRGHGGFDGEGKIQVMQVIRATN